MGASFSIRLSPSSVTIFRGSVNYLRSYSLLFHLQWHLPLWALRLGMHLLPLLNLPQLELLLPQLDLPFQVLEFPQLEFQLPQLKLPLPEHQLGPHQLLLWQSSCSECSHCRTCSGEITAVCATTQQLLPQHVMHDKITHRSWLNCYLTCALSWMEELGLLFNQSLKVKKSRCPMLLTLLNGLRMGIHQIRSCFHWSPDLVLHTEQGFSLSCCNPAMGAMTVPTKTTNYSISKVYSWLSKYTVFIFNIMCDEITRPD